MRNLRVIIIVLLAVFTTQACHRSSPLTGSADDSDSIVADTDTTSTLNLAVDKSDSDFAVDAAPVSDAAGGPGDRDGWGSAGAGGEERDDE